ncbi:MAG: hypothetical protein CNE98_06040 [Bacteroidetes bacterium MED-G17]|nr:MAG: hypothetical protein CNE98_06040 [Bacteroidetes bacterium MED-G17]CAI8279489.1 MAG: Diadenosine hexaphosphate hydrolase [Bacteroidetes bacterium MED-G17]
MNKIYFENSFIEFIDIKSKPKTNPYTIQCKKINELNDLTEKVKQQSLEDKAVVLCNDPEVYFQKFLAQFPLIEAAGGLVLNAKNELLFIEKRNYLDLPKGKIDKGESALEAAIREVGEETGAGTLQMVRESVVSYHFFQYPKEKLKVKKTKWYILNCDDTKNLRPQPDEDITKVFFLHPQKALESLTKTYPSILDIITRSALL